MTNLDRYKLYSQCIEHTPLYVEFSFYSLIASCLQRRYYTGSMAWPIYPNMYMIFVGDPATSKTICAKTNFRIIDKINLDWCNKKGVKSSKQTDMEIIHVAPDSITVEKLIYRMAAVNNSFKDLDTNVPTPHSSVTFSSEELGVLLKFNDTNLIEFLKAAWDCAITFTRETVGHGHQTIGRPCVNLIAGTTPVWIQDAISYGILNDGIVGRAIFIWGGKPDKKVTFFEPSFEEQKALDYVIEHCKSITDEVGGYIPFTEEARKYFIDWYENKHKPLNDDKSLQHYYGRKKVLTMKMALINSFADPRDRKEIRVEDIDTALATLERAEVNMHLALSSSGKNPLHKLAVDIFNFMKRRSKPLSKELISVYFHTDGDVDAVEKSLKYLLAAQKLNYNPPSGDCNEWTYSVNPMYRGD